MNSPRTIFLSVLFGLAALATAVEPVTELLTEAQTAYLRGEYESAKAKFESVLKLSPSNTTAIGYLRQIRARETERGGNASQERQLASLIVPSVQFRDATLTAVLDSLRQQAAKLSGGKQAINFVVQLTPEQAQASVSLTLANVPFTEVLKYVGQLTAVKFTFDRYAIKVQPSGAAATGARADSKAEEPPK